MGLCSKEEETVLQFFLPSPTDLNPCRPPLLRTWSLITFLNELGLIFIPLRTSNIHDVAPATRSLNILRFRTPAYHCINIVKPTFPHDYNWLNRHSTAVRPNSTLSGAAAYLVTYPIKIHIDIPTTLHPCKCVRRPMVHMHKLTSSPTLSVAQYQFSFHVI